MTKDTEIDMEEVKLNEVELEKQLMADGQPAAGEKNGSVKLKVPEDEVTFTGLSKDELMKVAGTPGYGFSRLPNPRGELVHENLNISPHLVFIVRWVRTRCVLLVLFWLGWVGMLAGAIVIIVQAPRCKPIPEMSWWNEGPLYQISDLEAFSGGMEGNVCLDFRTNACFYFALCQLCSQNNTVEGIKVSGPADSCGRSLVTVAKVLHGLYQPTKILKALTRLTKGQRDTRRNKPLLSCLLIRSEVKLSNTDFSLERVLPLL